MISRRGANPSLQMCGASARYMFSTILEEQIDFVVPPSIVHRDSIVWNVLSVHYDDNNIQSVKSCCKMAEKVDTLHRMDINALYLCNLFLILKEDFLFY